MELRHLSRKLYGTGGLYAHLLRWRLVLCKSKLERGGMSSFQIEQT
jgi:hypothetical protein